MNSTKFTSYLMNDETLRYLTHEFDTLKLLLRSLPPVEYMNDEAQRLRNEIAASVADKRCEVMQRIIEISREEDL